MTRPRYGNDRQYNLKRKYGMTVEQYDKLLAEQGGVCALCGEPETSTFRGTVKMLAVDHDHGTGLVRGLLCYRCNTDLGKYEKVRANPRLHDYMRNEHD